MNRIVARIVIEKDEDDFKKLHWHYSEFEEKYYENQSDLDVINVWNRDLCKYFPWTIGKELLKEMDVLLYDDEYYDEWDHESGVPYGINE